MKMMMKRRMRRRMERHLAHDDVKGEGGGALQGRLPRDVIGQIRQLAELEVVALLLGRLHPDHEGKDQTVRGSGTQAG